jgi:hypothetical protein
MFTPVGEGGRMPQSRRTGRVRRILWAALTLSLLSGAGLAVWRVGFNASADDDHVAACPQPTRMTANPITVVRPPQVVLNVYNATDREGLAGRTAKQLKDLGFTVRKVANDPLERHVATVAEIRSGAKETARVALVQAYLPGATAVVDRRTDATVDVVLGSAFRRLNSPAQVQAVLSPTPTPTVGAC